MINTPKEVYISISIASDKKMIGLNKEYKGKDCTTDVLAFNIDDDLQPDRYYLGDVVVNKSQAERQAREYGNSVEQEIAELISHGVLHLLGVHHVGDAH